MSKYVAGLCTRGAVYARYLQKIAAVGVDPYSYLEQFENAFEELQESHCVKVTLPDLYEYFVTRVSFYTHEELRCYKGLKAYNTFVSGWVSKVKMVELNGHYLLMCEVSS